MGLQIAILKSVRDAQIAAKQKETLEVKPKTAGKCSARAFSGGLRAYGVLE